MTNRLRTEPTYFIPMLEDRLQYFDENKVLRVPGRNGLQTKEGPAAVKDAIDFLAGVQPLSALSWRSGMA